MKKLVDSNCAGLRLGSSATALGLALALSQMAAAPAWAQAADAATAAPAEEVAAAPAVEQAAAPAAATEDAAPAQSGEIIVTGTRLASGFSAPTPVSVVGAERLQERGAPNIGEVLNELPSFRGTNTPAATGLRPAGNYVGGRILDLRGLGAERTLTLVDGKRFVPSTTSATVDTNMIPGILLQRAEVVTGGASAAYGSDAVAGVVNLILDKKLDGVKGNIQQGLSRYNDNSVTQLGLAFGSSLGEDFHVIVGGEWEKSRGVGDCQQRDWCRDEYLNFGRNPGDLSIPANNILPDIRPSTVPFNGLIVPIGYTSGAPILGPLGGITFNDDGTPRRFQFGSRVNNLFMTGGEGEGEDTYFRDLAIVSPTERYNLMGHLDWDITPSIKAGLSVNYGHHEGVHAALQYRNSNITIFRDNPFIPSSSDPTLDVRGILDADPTIASFKFGRGFADVGSGWINTKVNVFRTVASLEGKLGGGWAWDAYYQYGHNKFRADLTNGAVSARFLRAMDSVRNGAGTIVCRVNADASAANDDAACVPLNPFGQQISQAAMDYVTDEGFQTNVTNEHVAAFNVRGNLFDLPAGPLAVAAGGEFRSDKVNGEADAISRTLGFFAGNGSRIAGKIDVTEGYVETEVPILSDQSFFQELSLNGAVRRTHYKRSSALLPGQDSTVNVTTWKVGGIWEPTDFLRFRTTRSRDIRAPNVAEMFGPTTVATGILTDPAKGGLQTTATVFSGSNPNLVPEVADTFTVGVVLTPQSGFLSRFRASIDYYEIKIADAISTLGQQTIVTQCNNGDALSCSLITRAPSPGPGQVGAVLEVRDVLQNVSQFTTRGVDLELSYRQPLGALGSLDFRLLGTYVKDLISGGVERAGQTGLRAGTPPGIPDYTVDGMMTWKYNDFLFSTHVRYISEGIYNAAFIGAEQEGYNIALPNSSNTNTVPARTYVDLLAQYRVSYGTDRDFTFFAGVDNVFNVDPPRVPGANGTGNNVLFNPVGQSFKAGVRFTY